MKNIDMILNGVGEQYSSLINKLSNILEPYALFAMGKAPVYVGRIVEKLSIKQCNEYSTFVFNIDGNDVAYVNLEEMEASVFGSAYFYLTTDDVESIKNVLKALKGCTNDSIYKGFIKDIIEGTSKEFKSLLGTIIVSTLRKEEGNTN